MPTVKPTTEALDFVTGLTGHERSALRHFLAYPQKFGNLALLAITAVVVKPPDADPDALITANEFDKAVLTLVAALEMMDGATARH